LLALEVVAHAAPPSWEAGWLIEPKGPVQLSGDVLVVRDGGSQIELSGSVRVQAERLEIRANHLMAWPARRRALLQGQVRVIDRGRVVLCDSLVLDSVRAEALLTGATILVK
jgi:hypothetical protein